MTTTPHASITIGGTIAIDHVKTPAAEAQNLLGGSAAYAALAASFFTSPVALIGIIGHDFPSQHLDMLEAHGISLDGVERSANESFTWSGEYHANMNERTTHRVGLNVLENWQVKVPTAVATAPIVVLANMSPDNQLEMLAQCGIAPHTERGIHPGLHSFIHSSSSSPLDSGISPLDSKSRFVIADTMDLWIEIANERLHEVLPHLDLFVLNEGEARDLAGTSNLVQAGHLLLAKGPRQVVIKLGEFGAMLFSSSSTSSPSTPTSSLATLNPQFSTSSNLFRCSAFPLATVADPTGAGDTFLGGMAGYLAAQGPPPYAAPVIRQAVIHGSILASFTCEAFSTRRLESLTPEELAARIQEFRSVTHW